MFVDGLASSFVYDSLALRLLHGGGLKKAGHLGRDGDEVAVGR